MKFILGNVGRVSWGVSEQVYGISGLQASPRSRHHFAGMLGARQKMITQSMGSPVNPKGRSLKHASAAVQFLLRAKAINSKLRLAPARFRSRRDAIDLFRGFLDT